jgi:subtilisin-like proprotein convertase family protein
VTGIIAVVGYNLYSEAFPVIEAYGQVAGAVTSGGSALSGVTVTMLDGGGAEVFSVVTDALGAYAAPEDILVDDYTVVVDQFGYLHYAQAVFVNYGANTFDVDLTPAPSGILSGTVTDIVTGAPLEATVRVYRSDDGSLYTETVCDAGGAFSTSSLPYFTYNIQVRAYHYRTLNIAMTIEQPETVKGFALEATNGDLFIIDDGAKSADRPVKLGGKLGDELLADAYSAPAGKSAAQLALDLEDLGYAVTVKTADSVDPATFDDYDLVILSCGDNTSTLANATVKAGLVTFAQAGGHILLEGGELGYNQYGDADFATYVMHSNDWNADNAGTITVADAAAYILNNPNNAAVPMDLTYVGYGDSDAMAPLADAEAPLSWSGYATDGSVITYDPNPAPEGGQIVFFTFNYLAAGAERSALLENAVAWLLTPEAGNCSIAGTAHLSGMADHSGITVTVLPGGATTTTGSDGGFMLSGLFAGDCTVYASKENWSTELQAVSLADGENLTGVELTLLPTASAEACSSPAAPISDNTTISDTMTMAAAGTISSIAVYVDITHTYQGDLTVTLTSPAGTAVVLHNRTGSGADNIIGWYPDTLSPDGDLGLLTGEEMSGDWTLTVSDGAGGDTGTLNSWCVNVTYAGYVSAVDPDGLPTALALRGNYPNPFNPSTTIRFDVPRPGHVQLEIFDVAGRLVRTLVDTRLPAATHDVVWDGRDGRGRGVASGVFYYRLTTADGSATAKMLLLK